MRRIESPFSRQHNLFSRFFAVMLPLLCGILMLSQTAFAQNTYVITDGDRVLVHTTYSSDPAAVLNEAGLELGAEDTYTTQEGNGVSEITVQRVQTVYINHCGEQIAAPVNGETVGALLERLNIDTGGNTQVSVPLETQVYDGMHLTVSRTTRVRQTYTKVIGYETTYCEDETLPEGTQSVLTQGKEGELVCTAEVTYQDGVELRRVVLEEQVTVQPVNAVVAVGTAAPKAETVSTDSTDKAVAGVTITGDTITLPGGEVLTYTKSMNVVATAYTSTDDGCSETTATGTRARVGVVAVDPDVIPYGTRMFVQTSDGSYIYGIATAEDCGGAINGHRIDLYFDTQWECFQFGVQDCTIYILG